MTNFISDQNAPILVEFTPTPGVQKTSLTVAEIAEKSARALDTAMNTIHYMALQVSDTIDALAKRPSQVEVEFGIKLNAESGALIAKAGVEGTLNVKLTWKRKEESHEQ